MKLLILFGYVSVTSAAIPLTAGVSKWNRLKSNLKLIPTLAFISVITEVISLIILNYRITNWPIGNIYFIIQFIAFYYLLDSQQKSVLMFWIFIGCIIFSFLNFCFIQGPYTFNSYTSYVCALLLIIQALRYLYSLILVLPGEKVEDMPYFWLTFGILVYYGGNLFLFLFNNFMITNIKEGNQIIWCLHNILNIAKNVFLLMALIKCKEDSRYTV